jgi:hypothetical protein
LSRPGRSQRYAWIELTAQIMFYCHYPDKLLTGRETCLKKLYRAPLDWLEEWTTGNVMLRVCPDHVVGGPYPSARFSLHRADTLTLTSYTQKIYLQYLSQVVRTA